MPATVLVSGASTGIGEACALRLARKGHAVYAGVRKDADAQRLGSHANVTPVMLDVTDQATIDDVAERIRGAEGELQGVVNNAGIARGGPVEFLPLDEWREQLEVNVLGQVACTKAMMPLVRDGRGRVVFIGSIGGKVASPMMGPYSASKFAVEAIGESLRHELHPWGLHVSVVEPGAIKTDIWQKGRETADRLDRELPEEARKLYADHITAVREAIEMQDRNGIGPEKVAEAVEHALCARRPKTRYTVGTDAKAQSVLVRLLPDRVREAIVRRFAGL